MGELGNAHTIAVGKPETRELLRDSGADGKSLLNGP
jgi:hypothetical protein